MHQQPCPLPARYSFCRKRSDPLIDFPTITHDHEPRQRREVIQASEDTSGAIDSVARLVLIQDLCHRLFFAAFTSR
jgi:hypothetical protein